jgi:LAS superfamily LD-carboxypeptidase LdcB
MKPILALAAILVLSVLCGCVALRRPSSGRCDEPSAYASAALYNASAQRNLAFSPFGRPEQGWRIYAPAIAREVRSSCPTDSVGFARSVARWQSRARLPAHGALDPATFEAMKSVWQQRRPFVRLRAARVCPAPARDLELVAVPDPTAGAGAVRLRPGALAALQRLRAAARREAPAIAADPQLLSVFSGFRSPDYDAARCAKEGNCDGVVRASCSAHRTGLAVDLDLGSAPGFAIDSSADANRLWQTQSPAYQWLVANAARFGFVNYPFEPWHWEWTGQAP